MSDQPAPRGRGRGRGRRIAATTLAGPVASASPSPAPASASRDPSHDATEDALMADATTSAAPDPTSAAAASAVPPPTAAPARRVSVKRVASVGVGSTRAASVGLSRTPSLGPSPAVATAPPAASTAAPRSRPVGGLLAHQSEYRAGTPASGTTTAAKHKFKPNMRRTLRVQDDENDEDVKMEDADSSYRDRRGPRAPRTRQDLEMTASGPMAQGPGGPPRTWGVARPMGASGAAVMAASRAGTLHRMLDDDSDASDLDRHDGPGEDDNNDEEGDEGGHIRRFRAVDLNDIGGPADTARGGYAAAAGAGEDEPVTPLTLPRDPKVLRTKIRRLQERKAERLQKEARNKAKAEGLVVKAEPTDDASPLPGSTSATPNGTPGPSPLAAASAAAVANSVDSKEGSLALLSVDDDKEAKDLKDLEEEEKKEINLSEAFDLAPETRGELYMFQFPRKFPVLGPLVGDDPPPTVKPDPDAAAAAPTRKSAAPPDWGRFGSRAEKAARWTPDLQGRIGQLRVHRSGKVTLKITGDLRYEVLPAAQPSFLQEVAVLDHRTSAAAAAAAAAAANGHSTDADARDSTKKKKKKASRERRGRRGSVGSSSSRSSVAMSGTEHASSDSDSDSQSDSNPTRSRRSRRPIPPEALVVLGQTSKKFLVVPDINDLLDGVARQEKEEREAERRVKMERAKNGAGGAGGAGVGPGAHSSGSRGKR